jgi:hypothetical protein
VPGPPARAGATTPAREVGAQRRRRRLERVVRVRLHDPGPVTLVIHPRVQSSRRSVMTSWTDGAREQGLEPHAQERRQIAATQLASAFDLAHFAGQLRVAEPRRQARQVGRVASDGSRANALR